MAMAAFQTRIVDPVGAVLTGRKRLTAMATVIAVYLCLLGLIGVANYLLN